MNMQNINNKLDNIWKDASGYFPVCFVVYKEVGLDLNTKNRIQYVLSQVCTITKLQLPPVKGNGECTREKIINSFFSIK